MYLDRVWVVNFETADTCCCFIVLFSDLSISFCLDMSKSCNPQYYQHVTRDFNVANAFREQLYFAIQEVKL